MDLSGVAQSMREEGYAVVEGAISPAQCREIVELVEETYAKLGSPPLVHDGFNIVPLLAHAPRLAPYYALPAVLDVVEELLGEPPRLVHASVRISDEKSSAFVDWHHHYALPNDCAVTRRHMERILFNIYPVGATRGSGPLLLRRRSFHDPIEAPPAVARADWPGQVELTCEPGAVVFMDSAGYHTPKRGTEGGRRYCFRSQYQGWSVTTPCDEDNDCDPPSVQAYKGENARFQDLVSRAR